MHLTKPVRLSIELTGEEGSVEQDETDDGSFEDDVADDLVQPVADLLQGSRSLYVAASLVLATLLLFATRVNFISSFLVVTVTISIMLILVFVDTILCKLLLSHLLPAFGFLFGLLLSSVFLSESLVQVTGLDGNHEVENDEGTEDDAADEEQVEGDRFFSFSDKIHHISPAFQRDDLENVEDGVEDTVEGVGALDGVTNGDARRADVVRLARYIAPSLTPADDFDLIITQKT